MMTVLKGRVAVVTGAASGIGRGLAERFAAEGMRLVLADIQPAPLEALAAELRSKGTEVITGITDVASDAAVEALAKVAYDGFGAVHVLCNNAGIVPGARFAPIWEYSVQDWQWSLGVNLMGVVNGIRSFVPKMRAGGEWGHVVNTISVAGLVSGANSPAYGAAKHAALRATEALHASLKEENSPIGVTALCPGVVLTAISDSERNRPRDLVPEDGVKGDDPQIVEKYRSVKGAGLMPADVAEMVVKAIHARQFYLVTTTAFDRGVKERMEAILERRDPDFPDILVMSQEETNARS
jgi:NAD(P)-dependent dehydrogenase (short-subunit alcohol dehydrogenase family)